jgi:ABC-type cobalamin/Fe3+-siderophores transport system ATPase subunit
LLESEATRAQGAALPTPEPPLLVARDLSWGPGDQPVVGPLALTLSRGEAVAVVGPNGAGKTTLLRMLAGVFAPVTGTVAWHGEELAALSRRELARRLAYLPQQRPLSIPLSVERFVLLARYPHQRGPLRGPGDRDFTAVAAALERVGLEGLGSRLMDTLSGGERQRALIAAALAQEATVWLLDEPTTHLDPGHQREVAALLEGLYRDGGHTLILATHDLNLAGHLARRVVALREGRIAADGPAQEILSPEALLELFGAPFQVTSQGGRRKVWLEL